MPRLLVLLSLLATTVSVKAQQLWTVQVAAFQDHRQATSLVEELLELGFDAYSEFTMHEGEQYSRVRIGCFTARETASTFARDLRGNVTQEAVAQPLTSGAEVRACVDWDTGFVKPEQWGVVRVGNDIVFRVELGGQVGYVLFDGKEWQFGHALAPQPPVPLASGTPLEAVPVPSATLFQEARAGALTIVQAESIGGQRVNVCAGKLLWQNGTNAVVERPNTVIACRVDEMLAGDGR